MKVLYVLWAILLGMLIGFASLLVLPFILLHAGVKIIRGMATKIH